MRSAENLVRALGEEREIIAEAVVTSSPSPEGWARLAPNRAAHWRAAADDLSSAFGLARFSRPDGRHLLAWSGQYQSNGHKGMAVRSPLTADCSDVAGFGEASGQGDEPGPSPRMIWQVIHGPGCPRGPNLESSLWRAMPHDPK